MAVAFDASTESHTGTTGSTSQASFTWTHTPVGTPRGVLVFAFDANANAIDTTSVSYGSLALSLVAGGTAQDTATEPGSCVAYFAGRGIPTGAQTVTVNRTNNANTVYAVSITVTANTDTECVNPVALSNDQAPAEQSVTDGPAPTNSLRLAGAYYGGAAPPVVGANSTSLQTIDFGAFTVGVARETTAGAGARSVGFSDVSDDLAAVHVAVRELLVIPLPTTLPQTAAAWTW